MTRHAVKTSSFRDDTGRYEVVVTPAEWWSCYRVQLKTTHTIIDYKGDSVAEVVTELEDPPVRPTLAWAEWKGRRMATRAHRRDVRQGQPWTIK